MHDVGFQAAEKRDAVTLMAIFPFVTAVCGEGRIHPLVLQANHGHPVSRSVLRVFGASSQPPIRQSRHGEPDAPLSKSALVTRRFRPRERGSCRVSDRLGVEDVAEVIDDQNAGTVGDGGLALELVAQRGYGRITGSPDSVDGSVLQPGDQLIRGDLRRN